MGKSTDMRIRHPNIYHPINDIANKTPPPACWHLSARSAFPCETAKKAAARQETISRLMSVVGKRDGWAYSKE